MLEAIYEAPLRSAHNQRISILANRHPQAKAHPSCLASLGNLVLGFIQEPVSPVCTRTEEDVFFS